MPGAIELARFAARVVPEPDLRADESGRVTPSSLRERSCDLCGIALDQLRGICVGGVHQHLNFRRTPAQNIASEMLGNDEHCFCGVR